MSISLAFKTKTILEHCPPNKVSRLYFWTKHTLHQQDQEQESNKDNNEDKNNYNLF